MALFVTESGRSTRADDPKRSVFYAVCGFWQDDWSVIPESGKIPVCPGCRRVGFITNAGDWERGVAEQDGREPGYAAFTRGNKNKCLAKEGGFNAAWGRHRLSAALTVATQSTTRADEAGHLSRGTGATAMSKIVDANGVELKIGDKVSVPMEVKRIDSGTSRGAVVLVPCLPGLAPTNLNAEYPFDGPQLVADTGDGTFKLKPPEERGQKRDDAPEDRGHEIREGELVDPNLAEKPVRPIDAENPAAPSRPGPASGHDATDGKSAQQSQSRRPDEETSDR